MQTFVRLLKAQYLIYSYPQILLQSLLFSGEFYFASIVPKHPTLKKHTDMSNSYIATSQKAEMKMVML